MIMRLFTKVHLKIFYFFLFYGFDSNKKIGFNLLILIRMENFIFYSSVLGKS